MLGLGLIGIIGAIVSIGPGHFNPANSSESFRLLFFCVLCILNGVQMAVANYLYSVMALPRHLDAIPRSARDTALQDL
jgi:hypothetical protein